MNLDNYDFSVSDEDLVVLTDMDDKMKVKHGGVNIWKIRKL